LQAGVVEARFHASEPRARFSLDHVLLVPRSGPLVAQNP
jgi:hypothetical protein